MNGFERSANVRRKAHRTTEILSNVAELGLKPGEIECLHILWLYPDILNLHGGRGDVMALLHTADLIGLPVEIRRWDKLDEDIPFDWAHIICMTSGELKCAPEVIKSMGKQPKAMDGFLKRGGMLWAAGSSGAVLGEEVVFLDGRTVRGIGLLAMTFRERTSVWGDDLWLETEDENGDCLQVMGNQIQVADVHLREGQRPFAKVLYGRGNCGDGFDGARKGNVIYTGCLGPVLVKNPKLAAAWLREAAKAAGLDAGSELRTEQISIEEKSFQLIKKFIELKNSSSQ